MSVNRATVMPQGRISLTSDVCEKMTLSVESQGAFICEDDHEKNPAIRAMEKLQKEMEGEAERVGLMTEEDIVAFCREIRAEIAAERRLRGHG